MRYQVISGNGSWTRSLHSSTTFDAEDGKVTVFGVALLWYKPKRRLSVSLWTRSWSTNIRLTGGEPTYPGY